MKYYLHCFALLFLLGKEAVAQKTITLDDCFTYYKFYPSNGGSLSYLSDGARYTELDAKGLRIFDLRQSEQVSVLELQLTEPARDFDDYAFSKDESKLLLRNGTVPVYRHSVLANYYVYDLKTQATTPVFEGGPLQLAALSPDGSKVLFVVGNNLFFKDLSAGGVTQVTTDGQPNAIINGLPDWVYEEEFSPVTGEGMIAARWSPDSKRIAYLRFDESKVPMFPLHWYEGAPYPRRTEFKYPKVGKNNASVTVHCYDLNTGATCSPDVKAAADDYLVRLNWTPDNQLIVSRLNRLQNRLDLLRLDVSQPAPAAQTVLTEQDPAYVEVHDNLFFLKDNNRFIWTSESDGFNHVYLRSLDNLTDKQLTSGNFDVTAFYGLDEKTGKFYYQTATPTPLDRQIWEGDLTGLAPKLLTPGPGTNDAAFSPSFDFYTLYYSDANTPPFVTVRTREGLPIDTLADNAQLPALCEEYGFAKKEFWSFPLSDGTVLNGWMIKPNNMMPDTKYPVLFDNYGGPGSQTVQNQYDGYVGSWHQMLAQKGVIVVSLDNRGTGARGRAFKKCTQLQLGKYETEDQIAAARYLGTLPFVDKGRIGIWGWSFGGYLSTSCILKGYDVFKMAMAVAPVTNWKWYDSAYTERYMHTTDDNAAGYESNSPINFANLLRGNNYLICHGIADDNVHFQQTTEMIDALIKANKQFETVYYPNRNHGIYGDNATMHLFAKLTDFVLRKL